jgi:hypothetical protein
MGIMSYYPRPFTFAYFSGFLLNNYAKTDALATIARIAIGAGILCGYPLTFTALREGFLDIIGTMTVLKPHLSID